MQISQRLSDTVRNAEQEHLLAFWDELDERQQLNLTNQIGTIEFDLIARQLQADGTGDKVDWPELARKAEPPQAIRAGDPQNSISIDHAKAAGEQLLSEGKAGFILVAGGQGTRLGFPHPKGLFPIGPVSNRTLFEVLIDLLRARSRRYGKPIPMYLMTSPATHEETVSFLDEHHRFGLADDELKIFCQGTMPAVDARTGKVLLDSKSSIALSPDGHGGMLEALEESGSLADIQQRGIEHLFYGQIDNPLVQVCDPELLGYHLLSGSELTTQVVKKAFPLEKVGNVVSIDGRVQIIEYSDLPDEVANETTPDGMPRLWAGNIAVHVFDVGFLNRMAGSPSSLPYHLANKKVPCLDQSGNLIEPESPNAIKFERFIFDLLPGAKNAIVIEGEKSQVFAPVKNATGAETDTPELARQAIIDLHRGWLKAAGVHFADGVAVEISPFLALDAEELASRLDAATIIEQDTFLVRE